MCDAHGVLTQKLGKGAYNVLSNEVPKLCDVIVCPVQPTLAHRSPEVLDPAELLDVRMRGRDGTITEVEQDVRTTEESPGIERAEELVFGSGFALAYRRAKPGPEDSYEDVGDRQLLIDQLLRATQSGYRSVFPTNQLERHTELRSDRLLQFGYDAR